MTKHTPGPWTLASNIQNRAQAVRINSPAGEPVAYAMHFENRPGVEYWHEAHRNARLIAAAPEMLSALIDLVNSSERTYDNRHEYDAARAVIQKANGE